MRTRFAALVVLMLSLSMPAYAAAEPELYELSFPGLDGKPHAFEQHRGEVLLINFWATWCPPCVREMPALNRLQNAFEGQPFSVVAISAGEQPDEVAAFVDKLDAPLNLTLLVDSEGRTFKEFKLRGLPMSYLFSANGQLIEVITGEKEWDNEEWQARIEKLLES